MKSLKPFYIDDYENNSSDDDADRDARQSDRGHWAGQFESILSLIGTAIGFANIWRFPYTCFKMGGGVFVFLFVTLLMTCGLPLFYMEVLIGQFSGKSPIHVWAICPLFKGVGVVMIFVSVLFVWYYSMMVGWVYYYFIQSFRPTLPWASCDNPWNTPACIGSLSSVVPVTASSITYTTNGTQPLYDSNNVTHDLVNNSKMATLEFWENNVLGISKGIEHMGTPQWHLIGCLFLTWLVAFMCLIKGVKSVGKVVYVTVLLPYVLLTVFLIKGLTLEGSWDGLMLYLYPDFTKLWDLELWTNVLLYVFYSLGAAWGCVITMASYNDFNHNAFRESVVVCVTDAFTCVYAGLPVFAILGHLSKITGKPLEEFQAAGPGLVFIAFPEALCRLPYPQVWSALFFATLIFHFVLGVDSLFSTFEAVSTTIVDQFYDRLHKYKTLVVMAIMTVFFVAAIPLTSPSGYYVIALIDHYFATFNVTLSALFEVIAIAWIYGADRLASDAEMMLGQKPSFLMRVMWCSVLPVFATAVNVLTFTNFTEPTLRFSPLAIPLGKLIAVGPVCIIPIVAVVQILREKGSIKQRLLKLSTPSSRWRPANHNASEIYKRNPYGYEKRLCDRIVVNIMGIRASRRTVQETEIPLKC